jgi:hypothetical protein
MNEQRIATDRLAAFSDAVMAVIITIMVLELKAPEEPPAVCTARDAPLDLDQLRASLCRFAAPACDRRHSARALPDESIYNIA